MAETPNKTAAELFAALPAVSQRPSLAVKEIIRRLEQNLPGLIDYANTQLELSGELAITKPALPYRWAPSVLVDVAANTVMVSMAVETSGLVPRIFKNQLSIIVYFLAEEIETDEQAEERFDLGGLIQGALLQFLDGVRDASDRRCWHQLKSTGIGALPEEWAGFSGCAVYFAADQNPDPNAKAWTKES